MQYQRHAERLETAARQFRTRRAGRRRQPVALDVREVHPTALEERPVFDQLADALATQGCRRARAAIAAVIAAVIAIPWQVAQGLPVELTERRSDALLQIDQVGAYD